MRSLRSGSVALVAASALALAACTGAGQPSIQQKAAPPTPASEAAVADALTLVGREGVSVVDGATGRVLSTIPGGVPAPDWSAVYTAASLDGSTAVTAIDPLTGATISTVQVRGDLAIQAVSDLGGPVALMAPSPDGTSAWSPEGRTLTGIVVADPLDGSIDRFRLRGNFEPEAFSTNGRSLYLLRYLPAIAPTHYRVTSLDLSKGKVWDVYGPDKVPVQNMTSTRLVQSLSPDASALYTLYSNQPPAFTAGYVPPVLDAAQAVAFVHTLDLANGFAMCVALPKVFGTARPQTSAMASSPDGRQVFVVDARNGAIAVMDSRRFRVTAFSRVDLSALGGGRISARVSADGRTLLVAGRAGMLELDAKTLATRDLIPTPGATTGLALSGDGERLYLSWAGRIEALDATTLDPVLTLLVPEAGSLASVAGTTP
jgi:DNA-binding beta-propeller fold protein YncE